MLLWVALFASGALALLTLHSMAFAFANAFDPRPHRPIVPASRPRSVARRRRSYYASREAAMLMVEIALSVGIVLTIVGLASMAALPPMLMIGAMLAQVAVLGSLVAPPVTVRFLGVGVRPAAMALAVAQLANAAFFIKAIQVLAF